MSAMHPRVFVGAGLGAMTPAGILVGHLVFGLVWGLLFWWLV